MTRAVRDRILKDVNRDASDHIRNHIHLTNCIHLKNHMHKHSPIMSDRSLMRDLVALQRSRSLRDPSGSPPSWHSPSVADVHLIKEDLISDTHVRRCHHHRPGGAMQNSPSSRCMNGCSSKDEIHEQSRIMRGESCERSSDCLPNVHHSRMKSLESDGAASSHNSGNGLRNHIVKSCEEAGLKKRRRVRGARRYRPARATDAQNEMSVASNSYCMEGFRGHDGHNVIVGGVPKNSCGIHWNWSRIHHRGKSILDKAGRSLSCGLSESRFKKCGSMDIHGMPFTSEFSCSSSKSNGADAMPLLLDAVDHASWRHDYSGELRIYFDNLLKPETDSDLASEGRSHTQRKFVNHRNRRHQSLTQKYTPKTFRDLIGQSLVVQALSNAITRRKVGLLYLFYGPHGTGKTSCARIFARALNCQSLAQHLKPCGVCNTCIAQSTGKSKNIKEIGSVSHIDCKSIIDALDDFVACKLQSQYRVFIFDECDSLSSECWSMILKVVDRAPRSVVVVLTCSSLEAVPHVVISRCQKFFFPKLKDADIIYTLQWIASKEDLEIDKDALKLIASRSDGSLRDAEMTMEQLSLLGKRISLALVQELVGLISDEKLVDLLDLALSADTVNTVKNLRDIMESGVVEPLALMSQLATVITDILAGSYEFAEERPRRKFFSRQTLSKEDMEKLRLALKTLSEAEKQLRASSDRITWLTAALLQLAPDQQYMLPGSSADASFHHSPLVSNNASLRDRLRKSNAETPFRRVGSSENVHHNIKPVYIASNNKDRLQGHRGIEEIWFEVVEKIPTNSLKEFMIREGNLISVSYGAAPTVQLVFSSQPTKLKAERFRLRLLEAFESVLGSPVTIDIRCQSKQDVRSGLILLPPMNTSTCMAMNGHCDAINRREIVEIEASPKEEYVGARGKNVITESDTDKNRNLSLVRSKVSLAHVIHQSEGCSQHSPVTIAEKIEQENLRLESRSRRLLCWKAPKEIHRKALRSGIRTRKPRTLLKFVPCGRCIAGRASRRPPRS